MKDLGLAEFWGPAFGFLGSLILFAKWFLGKIFLNLDRQQLIKTNDQKTIERLRAEYGAVILGQLKTTIDELKPIVEAHTKDLKSFKGDVEEIKKVQTVTREVVLEMLKVASKISQYYQDSQANIEKAKAGGNIIVQRLATIESTVANLGKVILKK